MVGFMCKPDKTYCHQRVKNPNRNCPAGWIDMDSIVLQKSLPFSKVGYLEVRNGIVTQANRF